jgi:hypothetical protein
VSSIDLLDVVLEDLRFTYLKLLSEADIASRKCPGKTTKKKSTIKGERM